MPLTFGDPDDIKARDLKAPRWINPPIETEPKVYIDMTEMDRKAIGALCAASLGSFHKPFVRDMAVIAKRPDGKITVRQQWNIYRLVYTYRRQIKDPDLIAESGRRLSR